MKENEIIHQCQEIEKELPGFMRGFFAYLRGNVLPMTRLAYLLDIKFFCNYLIKESGITNAEETKEIPLSDFKTIKSTNINTFLDYCRRYETETEKAIYIYENHNKSLARKKSSVSVLFKYLYRDELVEKNITDGFDPIRVPKAGEREIKALQDNEVMTMLDAVSTGGGLTKKEKEFWEKTKKRDKAILILFLTYGLRLSELQQLNVSSFNFSRGEFKIYRKRGKESTMPLNKSVIKVITEYLDTERASDDTLAPIHQDALFLSLQGTRMTERQIRELAKKYTSIGLMTSRKSGYSPHKLRATAATSLIGRGNSIFDVQALLDHEQVTTTQLYAAHKMNVKRDLVNDMEWELERTNERD
jgi:site-specific recombinase XerD